jgi:long-chain acyl-CoA synthetase
MRSGPTFQQLFNWAYNYRLDAMRRGESTPILDFIVYRKIRKMLGGRVRLMFSGGAPLSPETNDFIRVCIGAPLLQGYGLTETNACATLTEMDQVSPLDLKHACLSHLLVPAIVVFQNVPCTV